MGCVSVTVWGWQSDHVRTLGRAMCLVTVMCVSLVLLETTASGLVLPDTNNICVQKCLARCQQLEREQSGPLCCNCPAICGKSCKEQLKEDDINSNTFESNLNKPGIKSVSLFESPGKLCIGRKCDIPNSTWKLLSASCRPCRAKRKPRSPNLREAALIARSVGLDLGGLPIGETSLDSRDDGGSSKVIQPVHNLRIVALTQEKDGVLAQVAWDPPEGHRWLLVTWEGEGGVLRGNLLTNTSGTSLSLLPGIIYHIQISSGSAKDTSAFLEVDTRARPSSPEHSHPLHMFSGTEGLAGAVAAILVFLTVAVLLIRRWHHLRISSSKDIEQDFNHFKLYPPPVTLPTCPASGLQQPI